MTSQPRVDFERLQQIFSQTWDREPGTLGYFRLAGQVVKVRSLSLELFRQLTRPWAHLSCVPDDAQLEIDLMEEQITPQPYPVHFSLSDRGDYACQVLPRSRNAWRQKPARIVASYQPLPSLSLYELGRPLHAGISLWCNSLETPVIHAGLVQIDGQGVLIGGEAGRGKTTAALSCLENGHPFLADDLCILDAQFRGHSLYATTFLRPELRSRLAYLGEEQVLPRYSWEEKSLTYLHPLQRDRLCQETSIAAVVLPRPEGGASWARVSASRALQGLAPSSLLVGRLSAGQMGLERLTSLVQQSACFELAWTARPDRSMARIVQQLSREKPRPIS